MARVKQCISAFKNLSKIVLMYDLGRGYPSSYTGWMSGQSELLWNEVKDLATSQLEGSLVDGPKRLKTVMMWGVENRPEPGLVVEEIVF